jgi:hypothetical protein
VIFQSHPDLIVSQRRLLLGDQEIGLVVNNHVDHGLWGEARVAFLPRRVQELGRLGRHRRNPRLRDQGARPPALADSVDEQAAVALEDDVRAAARELDQARQVLGVAHLEQEPAARPQRPRDAAQHGIVGLAVEAANEVNQLTIASTR